eukprot:c31115_g1_i1 orf=98-322(+)
MLVSLNEQPYLLTRVLQLCMMTIFYATFSISSGCIFHWLEYLIIIHVKLTYVASHVPMWITLIPLNCIIMFVDG